MSTLLKEGNRFVMPWDLSDQYDAAQTVTVAISVKLADPATDGPTVDLSDIFATVEWGSGRSGQGGSCGDDCQSVDLDCINGSSLTVEARSLSVIVTYPNATPPNAVVHPPVNVDVSIGIGTSGKAGITSSATRTIKAGGATGTIAGGGNSGPTLFTPKWATDAIVVSTTRAIVTLTIEQAMSNGGTVVSRKDTGRGSVDATPIARGLGARVFTVVNNNVGAADGVAVIFGLSPN